MTVTVNNVTKRIGGALVLDDITLEVPNGTVVGLSGVNGSGKTMLMRAMAGLIRPTEGEVRIDGKRLWRDIPFPPSVGLLIENPAFLDSRTGLQNLALLAAIKGAVGGRGRKMEGRRRERVVEVIRSVGLDPADKRKYRKYSLGMKQRLGIAAAVMEEPKLLLLDEPANALDTSGVAILKNTVRAERERGAAIVLACHDATILQELSDVIYYLAEGHIDGYEVVGGEVRHD